MKIMENIYMFELMKIELYFAIRCRCVLQDFPTQYCKEKVHTFAPEIFL